MEIEMSVSGSFANSLSVIIKYSVKISCNNILQSYVMIPYDCLSKCQNWCYVYAIIAQQDIPCDILSQFESHTCHQEEHSYKFLFFLLKTKYLPIVWSEMKAIIMMCRMSSMMVKDFEAPIIQSNIKGGGIAWCYWCYTKSIAKLMTSLTLMK